MSHHDHQEEPNPPAILYIGVLVAIVVTLHLLINVAAKPWGWPESALQGQGQHATSSSSH